MQGRERKGEKGKGGKEGRGGDPVCIFKFLRITYEIRRWRYTKFAKILALPEGAP